MATSRNDYQQILQKNPLKLPTKLLLNFIHNKDYKINFAIQFLKCSKNLQTTLHFRFETTGLTPLFCNHFQEPDTVPYTIYINLLHDHNLVA